MVAFSKFYNKIPETGGPLRSPFRDLYGSMIRGFIDGKLTVVDGNIEEVLRGKYEPGRKWRNLLDDTLLLFKGELVNRESRPSYSTRPNECVKELAIDVCNFMESFGIDVPDEFRHLLSDSIDNDDIYKYKEYQQYCKLQRLIAETEIIKTAGTLHQCYSCAHTFVNGEIHVYSTFAIVDWWETGEYSFYPFDALLGMRDTMLKRAIALYLSETRLNCLEAGYITRGCVEDIFEWGDVVLSKLGNDGYTTIAMYESLLTGSAISTYDSDFNNNEFLDEMTRSIHRLNDEDINLATNCMLNSFSRCNRCQLVQCFALFKVWSYPIVDEEEAMRTLIEYGRCEKLIDVNIMSILESIARRQFVLSYKHLRNRNPPNTTFEGNQGRHLYDVIYHNKKFDPDHEDYSLSDWNDVTVKGSVPPIFDVNIESYLKDRAISPELTQLMTVYNKQYIPDELKSDLGRKVRSGVEAFIKEDIMNAPKLIEYVSIYGAEDAWKVVGVTAKEKELKPTARLFAMLVLHMKLWFAITEDCLKKALFKFFPQQSMDKTSMQSGKKKLKMTQPTSNDVIKIIMNIDFSKWNTTFRYENTINIFLFIDEAFDFTNVFSYTHKFFQECRTYISSRHCIPEVLPLCTSVDQAIHPDTQCDTWFHGFLGGFEGQRQKGWTLVTLLFMIHVIENMAGIKNYELYGQGDNQVICILLKKEELCPYHERPDRTSIEHYEAQIKEKISALRNSLSTACSELGLRVKIAETWYSSNFFQYSKDFYIHGGKMPLDMKLLMALSPHTKAIVPTQVTIFQTMTAAVNSCFDSSHNTLVTYLCGMYIIGALMLEHDETYSRTVGYHKNKTHSFEHLRGLDKIVQKGNKDLLMMMMKIPSSLGGMCDIQISNLLRKGAGDHVESAIDCIQRSKCRRGLHYIAKLNHYGFQEEEKTDKSILVDSPLSLNLKIMGSGGGVSLHEGTMSYLKNNANGEILKALDDYSSPKRKEFMKGLVPSKGYDAVLAGILYSLSPYAAVDSLMDKLDNTTLHRLAEITLSDYIGQVKDTNERKFEHFMMMCEYSGADTSRLLTRDSTIIAETLRKHWYVDELSLPISRFNPRIELFTMAEREELPELVRSSDILVKLQSSTSNNLKACRGPEKMSSRVTNVPSSVTTNVNIVEGSIKRSIEQLADVHNYATEGNEELKDKIQEHISKVTDAKLSFIIDPACCEKSRLLETISNASASNFSTHCKIFVSDEIRGERDDEVKFQYSKAKVLGLAVVETQFMIYRATKRVPDSSYWINIVGKITPLPRPKASYDFTASSISYPNSDRYFSKSIVTAYNPYLVNRKTDSILRCVMVIDMAIAKAEFIEGSGVERSSIPYHILDEDVQLFCIIASLRFLMYSRLKLTVSAEELKEEIEGPETTKLLYEIFRRHVSDEGCMRISESFIPSFINYNKTEDRCRFLLAYGVTKSQQMYENSSTYICRLFPMYEHNESQYRFIFSASVEFLLETIGVSSKEINCDADNFNECQSLILEKYGTPLIHYGRKHKHIKSMSGSLNHPAITYGQCVTSDFEDEYPSSNAGARYCQSALMKSLGLFYATVSLIEKQGYDVVLILTDAPQPSQFAVISLYRNILRGRDIHGKLGCTIISYSEMKPEIFAIHGPRKLEIYSKLSESIGIFQVCMSLEVSSLHVSVNNFRAGMDALTLDSYSMPKNVHSVFCNGLCYLPMNGVSMYRYLDKSWNASSLIPDWAISLMIMGDLKDLFPSNEYARPVSEEEINQYLNDRGITDDDQFPQFADVDLRNRVSRFRESIVGYRVWFLASRLHLTEDDIFDKGGTGYSYGNDGGRLQVNFD